MRRLRWAALAAVLSGMAVAPAASAATIRLGEFRVPADALERIRDRQIDRLLATHERGTWAPIPTKLTNADLRDMGLPAKRHLRGKRFPVPTVVHRDGRMVRLGAKAGPDKDGGGKGGSGGGGSAGQHPGVTFAGTGFFGIRPGAWLLLLNDGIGWCSFAHVHGSPGSYDISTAGHCGKVGDIATVIGTTTAGEPVLIDIGKFSKSTGDGGIGRDHAMIDVLPQYQHLVTPTMAGWGGPFGVFTKTGDVVSANLFSKNPLPSVNPDPFLAQQILHYGHGTGVGAGGTPRSGTAIVWRPDYFAFFGAISPGDSGSGSNTLTGDTIGAQREAAGINTHLYVDPSLRTGLGFMAGTRTTKVGTPANGQLIPYPVPAPILP